MPVSVSTRIALSVFSSARPMPRSTCGALVNWTLPYSITSTRLPQGSRKSRKGPHQTRACRLCERPDLRSVVHHHAEVPLPVLVRRLGLHERDELVAHVDKGLALAAAAELELENLPIEIERCIDIAHLEGDMVHADEFRPPRCISGLGHSATSRRNWVTGA